MKTEEAAEELVAWCRYLDIRGLCPGSSGNVSCRVEEGFICTPTGSALGEVAPETLALIAPDGRATARGSAPTKEWRLHLGVYAMRPEVSAIVHLHSRYAVAASCRADTDTDNVIPPLTSYYAMNVERLPLVPWNPPGSVELADAVRKRATESPMLMLANHGPVVGASSLASAAHISEEVEEAAAVWLALGGTGYRALSSEQIRKLRQAGTGTSVRRGTTR